MKRNNWEEPPEPVRVLKIVALVVILVAVLVVFFSSWYIVNAGHRGVILTWGAPSQVASEEGLHFKVPIMQSVVKMNVQTQKYEADATAASKDLQIVTAKIAVNYHLVPESVPRLYQEIGPAYQERVIQPAVQEVVKAATAQFTAEELITERASVKENIKTRLDERLRGRGIIVEDISIVDFDFSESFNQAIEAKVTAEQLKLKAERDLQRIQIEAQQKIENAKAEAEALRLQRQEVSVDLIELRKIEVQRMAIEKWDGKMPQITGGALPFINVDQGVTP